MKKINRTVGLAIATTLTTGINAYTEDNAAAKPNVIIMVQDNLGWGEVGCYGGGLLRGAPTPNIDRLANQGIKLLNFNVEAQCTPSRSSLMSGRFPIRSGTTKVVWGMPYGLVNWEVTMAELFSQSGYKTAMYGKWHLGEIKGRFPTDQGFDEWYGIPNTTDEAMYSTQLGFDSKVAETPIIMQAKKGETPKKVKDYNLESRRTIDRELTEKTIDFIERSTKEKKPFFAFVPYTQCHLPPLCHPDFIGKTGNGVWSDMLAEMDYNVGQVVKTVDRLKIANNTIIIWMSENGPEEAPNYYGTAGYWRGHYFTALEGSLRAPFVMRWPGKIKPLGVSNEIVHISDLLPTFSSLAGYKVPTDRIIDGVDQSKFLLGKTEKSAREGFPVYQGDLIHAYKWRNFKVKFYQQDSMFAPVVKLNFPQVFNLLRDPKELHGLTGAAGESGTEGLTWLLPVITKKVIAHKMTLMKEKPIRMGTPEPYAPAKK